MIAIPDSAGLSNNTLIVYTSDNGMPLPRSKATLYDHGVRMPLFDGGPIPNEDSLNCIRIC